MNLGSAILALPTETITIERRSGAYSNGLWVAVPDGSPFDIQASVQQATGRDLQRLPQGQRKEGGLVLFIPSDDATVRIADKAAGKLADRFSFRGDLYEIDHVEDWTSEGYQRAIATLRAT